MKDMKLQGDFSCARVSGRDDDRCIHIEITDSGSGARVCHVNMTLEDFAKAITGQGSKCQIEIFDKQMARVGKIREHKYERVPITKGLSDAEVLAPYQVDGWVARAGDLRNGHLSSSENDIQYQRVSFERWVDKC